MSVVRACCETVCKCCSTYCVTLTYRPRKACRPAAPGHEAHSDAKALIPFAGHFAPIYSYLPRFTSLRAYPSHNRASSSAICKSCHAKPPTRVRIRKVRSAGSKFAIVVHCGSPCPLPCRSAEQAPAQFGYGYAFQASDDPPFYSHPSPVATLWRPCTISH